MCVCTYIRNYYCYYFGFPQLHARTYPRDFKLQEFSRGNVNHVDRVPYYGHVVVVVVVVVAVAAVVTIFRAFGGIILLLFEARSVILESNLSDDNRLSQCFGETNTGPAAAAAAVAAVLRGGGGGHEVVELFDAVLATGMLDQRTVGPAEQERILVRFSDNYIFRRGIAKEIANLVEELQREREKKGREGKMMLLYIKYTHTHTYIYISKYSKYRVRRNW